MGCSGTDVKEAEQKSSNLEKFNEGQNKYLRIIIKHSNELNSKEKDPKQEMIITNWKHLEEFNEEPTNDERKIIVLRNEFHVKAYKKKSNFSLNKSFERKNNKEQFMNEYDSDGEMMLKDNEEKNKIINIEEKILSIKLKKENSKKLEQNQKNHAIQDEVKDIAQNKENEIKNNKDYEKKENLFNEKYKKKLNELNKQKEEKMKKNEELEENLKMIQKYIDIYSREKLEIEAEEKAFDSKNKDKISKFQNLKERVKKKEQELAELNRKYFPKVEPILIGLNNIGATCYMNASLQCLSNTKELTEHFLTTYQKAPNKLMSNEYYEVLKNLWNRENNNKPYSPYSFKEVLSKENPLFAGIAANDSKDLINFLTERFHQELNIKNNNNNNTNPNLWSQIDQTNEFLVFNTFLHEFVTNFNSPISKLFYGLCETQSQCQSCKTTKYNFQVYSFLEFPLEQVNKYYFNKGKKPMLTANGKAPDINLEECFEYNRKIDWMVGDNQMYCNICKKNCDSTYVTYLYTGPKYLILHLNRGKGAVYECKVIFPEILNLFDFFTDKHGVTVYELYAVICHLGPSSMSGHFVAYCKNRMDNKWYLYNDSFVTLCDRKDQYTEGMPYILFYKTLTSDD